MSDQDARGVPVPAPRGPLSEQLVAVLCGARASGQELPAAARAATARAAAAARATADRARATAERARATAGAGAAVLADQDEDVQLTLALLYELHYRGLQGVPDHWEWSPPLIAVRAELERALERDLRRAARPLLAALPDPSPRPDRLPAALFDLVDAHEGPQLSGHLARSGTLEQFREFLIHRSWYHLKEADPHSWGIPRLSGAAKAALIEIQADEYGGGRPERMHAELFAAAMRAVGLDDRHGGYLECLPAVTLVWGNAMHLLGLNRRLQAGLAGHLAALEISSSLPNALYLKAVRRLELPEQAGWFFDEHVEADAVHEQIAARDLAGTLARQWPDRIGQILLGAAVALQTDAAVAEHLLSAWSAGRSSLRAGGPGHRAGSHVA